MADIANSGAATVRHGGAIVRRPSAAATGLEVELHLGQRDLGPPKIENVTEYCIWVGNTGVPKRQIEPDVLPCPTPRT